jgi:hypothetical protein
MPFRFNLLMHIILYAFVVTAAFLFGRFAEAIKRDGFLGTPTLVSDAEVISRIEAANVKVPPTARHLACIQMGFEEPYIWIAMEASPADRAAVIKEWFAATKLQPEVLGHGDVPSYDPERLKGFPGDLSRFAVSSWTRVRAMSARDPNDQFEYATFEDLSSNKLMLYYWRE